MKNSAGRGGCYPQRPKAEVDNTIRDLQNSSYPTKAEFNNCFIIPYISLFVKITQPRPQVSSIGQWFNTALLTSFY